MVLPKPLDYKLNIILCKLVSKYPCLYDENCPEYNCPDTKFRAWETIARKFNTGVPNVKYRWFSIKGCYVKTLIANHMKKMRAPGPRRRRIREYYLTPYLRFFNPFVKTREIFGYDLFSKDHGEGTEVDNVDEVENDDTYVPSIVMTGPSDGFLETKTEPITGGGFLKTRKSRAKPREDQVTISKGTISCDNFERDEQMDDVTLPEDSSGRYVPEQMEDQPSVTAERDVQQKSFDPDVAFLYSLLPEMRAMDDQQKHKFKMGILRLVGAILFPSAVSEHDRVETNVEVMDDDEYPDMYAPSVIRIEPRGNKTGKSRIGYKKKGNLRH